MNNTLEYKGYNGTVEYSQEDNVLFGKVLGIKSLISYEGQSIDELKTDFESAVDDYLDLCSEKGMKKNTIKYGGFVMKETALITGSYGGLGTQFVKIHAQRGGDLILVGKSKDKLDKQKADIEKEYDVKAFTIEADLSLPDAAQMIYDACKKNGLQVDYLINNAGFGGQGDFARERTMEQDLSMIAVNIETPTRLCKLFLPDFINRKSGKILNVSSTALQAVYYATKAYVTSLSNALWREVQGTGVTVTCLMPWAMKTGFANAGGLSDTKLFANAVAPDKVAMDGYNAMLKGKLNVTSGLISWQKPLMKLQPLFPKKMMLNFVYEQQLQGSANK